MCMIQDSVVNVYILNLAAHCTNEFILSHNFHTRIYGQLVDYKVLNWCFVAVGIYTEGVYIMGNGFPPMC